MTLATDRETRQMVALNADVVGYSRLMADDFAATTAVMDVYHRRQGNRGGGSHRYEPDGGSGQPAVGA